MCMYVYLNLVCAMLMLRSFMMRVGRDSYFVAPEFPLLQILALAIAFGILVATFRRIKSQSRLEQIEWLIKQSEIGRASCRERV